MWYQVEWDPLIPVLANTLAYRRRHSPTGRVSGDVPHERRASAVRDSTDKTGQQLEQVRIR
jgi:hypothetical protein